MVDKNISLNTLEEFKKLVRKSSFLTKKEEEIFSSITTDVWENIFIKNFGNNLEYAKRVLLNKYKEIETIDKNYLDKEKNKIHNLDKATDIILQALENKQKIVYITDFDNDGSLAQAVINEYLAIDKEAQKNSIVEYCQSLSGSQRGINLAHVDLIVEKNNLQNEDFVIVTADNGINSSDEVEKINLKYPKAKVIITDHHNPDEQMVVKENNNTVIFNPHYKPTPFFEEYNISGATTVGVLCKNVLEHRFIPTELLTYKNNLEKLDTLFKVSNMLDYVYTHPADKPEKDYIVSKFLKLQPLLNINNSISKIITGEVSPDIIDEIVEKIPSLDKNLILEESKNIKMQNHLAKVLLYIYNNFGKNNISNEMKLTKDNFQTIYLREINNDEHFLDTNNINPNYIEQLRPIIFSLSADYDKNTFLDALCDQMEIIYQSIKISEKNIGNELRKGQIITKHKLNNSTIAYADPNILTIFNRKFLNKVYNDENPGFSLTLDSIKPERVSGSFRSIYDISDILKEKNKLEKKLNIKIETPGHERAAGFIITSRDSKKNPITNKIIEEINDHIDKSITNIKENDKKSSPTYFLTDLNSISTIDKINKIVRGNISHFSYITPLLKLNENTVWTDSYTTKQYTLKDIINEKKYGYITINMDFHGSTIIVPVELIRKIVSRGYKDYLSLGYMDGGVFMVDKVIPSHEAKKIINLTRENEKESLISRAFERDFKEKNIVNLTREQIKDNPFFKYNDYGQLNFDLFERMCIGIIDTNKIDYLSVIDVEANGFGNSKIINFGSTNYEINPNSGQKINQNIFEKRFFSTLRGENYLLTSDQLDNLDKLNEDEKNKLPIEYKKFILIKENITNNIIDFEYYIDKNYQNWDAKKMKNLPYQQIKNYKIDEVKQEVLFNREIQATMLAYLINDNDFKIPQEMINLTGITQELLDMYGKKTSVVDKELSDFFKDKKVLFGAHNTPYDTRVIRANMPNFYNEIKKAKVYDSALFAKELKLAYDDVLMSYFDIEGLKGIYFYNNKHSSFSLTDMIENDKNGYYPDRTGRYLFEIDNASYYLVDKEKHEKIKIETNKENLLRQMSLSTIPNTSVKYSVEKLSEQWMIHSLLLSDEKFNIKHVDLNKNEYKNLRKYSSEMQFFQDNYHFDVSEGKNRSNFLSFYPEIYENNSASEEFNLLIKEFVQLNKDIQQKFSDAWMYKSVLEIKDPNKGEITNDLIDLVNYQTAIPKDKIKLIFKQAIAFKEKYKIDSVLFHETHANGPWREDLKGDIVFEDKLTLGLLAHREYNSYEHNINGAINTFNNTRIKAQISFNLADNLSDDLAQDSYSFRQGILYERDDMSPVINKIQEKEKDLSAKDKRHLVKFKLNNDILQEGKSLYAITKKHISLTRQDIEKHKKMLSFIMLFAQSQHSLKNSDVKRPLDESVALNDIVEANFYKVLDYKKELSDIYDYIDLSNKDYQLKKVVEYIKNKLLYNENKKRGGFPKTNEIDYLGLKIIDEATQNLIKDIKDKGNLSKENKENISEVQDLLSDMLLNHNNTKLEEAIYGNEELIINGFSDFTEVYEDNFLKNAKILKQNLGNVILKKHLDLKFLNNYIEAKDNFYLAQSLKNKKLKI